MKPTQTLRCLQAALLVPVAIAAPAWSAAPGGSGTTRIERWPDGKQAAFLMMFDDGCPSHVKHAIPELQKRNLTGTFYIIPNKGEYKAKLAFWEQEAPKLPGVVYGNHSFTHQGFTSAQHAEEEMVQANAVIVRLFPGPTPRLISFATPGGVKHEVSGEQIAEVAAKHNLVVRPTFQGHGAAIHYKTAPGILADVDKAAAAGALAYVIFHGVGGDWLSFPLDEYTALLDGLVQRRDALWIADPISVHKYETERETATVAVLEAGAAQLRLELTCKADAALFDQPLTLATRVPDAWSRCRITQGEREVMAEVAAGEVRYAARPGAGPITLAAAPAGKPGPARQGAAPR